MTTDCSGRRCVPPLNRNVHTRQGGDVIADFMVGEIHSCVHGNLRSSLEWLVEIIIASGDDDIDALARRNPRKRLRQARWSMQDRTRLPALIAQLWRAPKWRSVMKLWVIVACLLVACGGAHAKTVVWQPTAGHAQIPLWPGTPPDDKPMPGAEYMWSDPKALIGGKPVVGVKNVSRPTMTVYAPQGKNTGAAVVVFPGGGFELLAMDLEGTDVCDWLTSRGITCVLLKYRVPSVPYVWQCNCRPHNRAISVPSLEDAQRTLRLVRYHAVEWHIDPHKVGVLGFSAGGYLVAEISTNFARRLYSPVDAADKESARPDFAMPIYPGHLATDDDKLNPNVPVSRETPPTFLLQAEDDNVDGVNQSQVYYAALKNAGVPVEMHLYAHGGHAFGLRPTSDPITRWPALAEIWMSTIGMIPAAGR